MKRVYIFLVILLIALPLTVFGIERVGTTAFQFLKLPVGVRGIGMGNAFVAGAADASAVYWNPAGLGWATNSREVMLAHINLPADIKYDNIAFLLPISSTVGTFALSASVLSLDDILVRTAENPEGNGSYVTASDIALGLSYARQISDRFTFGGTVRYIREDLADYISSNVSFDAGLQYRTDFRSMRLGMLIQNFGPDAGFDGQFLDLRTSAGTSGRPASRSFEKAPMPITFKFGVMADLATMAGVDLGESLKGNIAAQFEHPSDAQERVNSGVELMINERFALRGGYNFNYDSDRFTLGFGVNVPMGSQNKLNLDYAYADQGDLTDTSSFLNQPHRFSLSFQW